MTNPSLSLRRRTAITLLGALCFVPLAGCGATTPSRGTPTGDAGASATTGITAPTAVGGPLAASGQPAGRTHAVSGDPLAAAAGSPGRAPATGVTSGAADPVSNRPTDIPATGPGWDRHTVYVGVTTETDIQEVGKAAGIRGLDTGDQKGDAQAMIDDLNRHGGLFGRTVKGVFQDISTAQDADSSGQAACTAFTQDNRVVAVINGAFANDVVSFRACLAKAQIPLIAFGATAYDDASFSEASGYYLQLFAPSWNRLAPPFARALEQMSYFHGWDASNGRAADGAAHIGVIAADTADGRRSADEIASAFNALHHPVTATFLFHDASDFQSAVLRFRAAGVTHVVSTDKYLVFFLVQAQSQQYFPRYGISTANGPEPLLQQEGPAQQLKGSVGIGWDPDLDTPRARQQAADTPGAGPCRALMSKAGHDYAANQFGDAYALLFCDAFHLLARGAQRGGGLTGPQILTGIASLGGGIPIASTFTNALTWTTHAMPGTYRGLRWDEGSAAFLYSGPQSSVR